MTQDQIDAPADSTKATSAKLRYFCESVERDTGPPVRGRAEAIALSAQNHWSGSLPSDLCCPKRSGTAVAPFR